MPQKLLLASLVLCLMFFGSTPLALAGEVDRETPTVSSIEQMISEGWTPVAEGVFQRSRGSSAVESIAVGPEGFAWRIQELQGQIERMEAENRAHPSKKLARVIAAVDALGRGAWDTHTTNINDTRSTTACDPYKVCIREPY